MLITWRDRTNGDGILDANESQIAEQFEDIRNSFIVELKPTAAGNINETLQVLTPELAAAGGTVSAVYDQFGMFGLKFEDLYLKLEYNLKGEK